jgi:hypothetical protein
MLLNCDELKWNLTDIVAALDRGELTYETLMYDMAVARSIRAAIDSSWNSLERYDPGQTGLLHYTDMPTQPWVSLENPNGSVWVRDLIAAVDSGFISRDYVVEHVGLGFVRPSLVYQLDHRIERSEDLPKSARALDARFVPPYKQMESAGGTGVTGRVHGLLRRVLGAVRPGSTAAR